MGQARLGGSFSRWMAENKPSPVGPVTVLVREWGGEPVRFQVFEVFVEGLNEGRLKKYGVRWPVRQKDKGQSLVYKTVYVTADSPEEALQLVVGKTAEDGFPSFDDDFATVVRGKLLAGGGADITLEHPGGHVENRRFGPEAQVLLDGKPASWNDVYLGWEWIAGGRWADGAVELNLKGPGGQSRSLKLPPGTKIMVDGVPGTWRDVKAKMMVREEGDEGGTHVLHLHRDPGVQHKQMQVRVKDGPSGPVLDFSTEGSSYMRHSHGGTLGQLGKYYDSITSRPKQRGQGMTKGFPRDQLRPQVFDLDDADKVMGQLDFTDDHRHKASVKTHGGVYDADDLAIMAREYLRLVKPLPALQHRLEVLLSDRKRATMDDARIELIQQAWAAFNGHIEQTASRRETLYKHVRGGFSHPDNQSSLEVPDEMWARNVDDSRDFDADDPRWDTRAVETHEEAAYIARFLCEMVLYVHEWLVTTAKTLYGKVQKREAWHAQYGGRNRRPSAPPSPEATGEGDRSAVDKDAATMGQASVFQPPADDEYAPDQLDIRSPVPRRRPVR